MPAEAAPPLIQPLIQPVIPPTALGPAHIVRMAYAASDLRPLLVDLTCRARNGHADPAALFDLATLLQSQGGELAEQGRIMLTAAAARTRDVQVRHGSGRGLRVLAFVTPGDFMANTPIDFLLQGSDAMLILHHVDAATPSLSGLPAHDIAFMAVAESPENAPVLARMAQLLRGWRGPVFNNAPALIATLTRDGVSGVLADEPSLLAPKVTRWTRAALCAALNAAPDLNLPLLLRPAGSHAGQGLARITTRADLHLWSAENRCEAAFAMPFIDYRRADGLYAKARVVMIKGQAFAGHLAISDHWMVHYLNAGMDRHPQRRAEEADWMRRFDAPPAAGCDAGFAWRHRSALAALHRRIGLDYYAIDCAELPDGRLLIFELDVAMIVHDMDAAEVFPYKKAAMKKLFSAFLQALTNEARARPTLRTLH